MLLFRTAFLLYDGDSKIMISPAINLADRLSGCSKYLRKHIRNQNPFYNLYVFKNAEDNDTNDDYSLRYNVNGIELSAEGFLKLSNEINLTKVSFKKGQSKDIKFYTGKVRTKQQYQQLIIREASVLMRSNVSLRMTKETSRKCHEICSNQEIYDFINNFGTNQNVM